MRAKRAGPITKTPIQLMQVEPGESVKVRAYFSPGRARVEPRLLRREDAASYLGVSASYFDKLCAKGLAPAARQLGTVKGWDRFEIDAVIDRLPRDGAPADGPSDWDE